MDPWPTGDNTMDVALDTAMNYLEHTGQAQNFVEVQRVAAMAILAAWKKGERRRVKLANLAIQAAERKAKPAGAACHGITVLPSRSCCSTDGVKLASLREAIAHLVKTIPSSDRGMPAVLTAAELLTKAAEHDGPVGSRVLLRCVRSIATLSGCLTPRAKTRIGDAAS